MRPYIVNLTNNLIGKNQYDRDFQRLHNNPEELLEHIQFDLCAGDVRTMTPEKLGTIMCSFEPGEVLSTHLGHEVSYGGDCESMLRELVSRALAYVIRDRLDPLRPNKVAPYKIRHELEWGPEFENVTFREFGRKIWELNQEFQSGEKPWRIPTSRELLIGALQTFFKHHQYWSNDEEKPNDKGYERRQTLVNVTTGNTFLDYRGNNLYDARPVR